MAKISGDEEVPPVETDASGMARFPLSRHDIGLSNPVNVQAIEDVAVDRTRWTGLAAGVPDRGSLQPPNTSYLSSRVRRATTILFNPQ